MIASESILGIHGFSLGDVLAFEDGTEIWMTGALCLRDTSDRWVMARDHLGVSVILFDETERAYVGACEELKGAIERAFTGLPEVVEWENAILSRTSRIPYRVIAEGDLLSHNGTDSIFAEYTGIGGSLLSRFWILKLKGVFWRIKASPALPFDRMEGSLTRDRG